MLFDLGNTLVRYYRGDEFEGVLASAMKGISEFLLGAGIAPPPFDRVMERARDENREAPDLRVRPVEERLARIFEISGAVRTEETMAGCVERFLRPIFAIAVLDPLAATVLEALRDRGVKTAVVSNTPWGTPARPWRGELQRHGLLEAVDGAVFCTDVGWRLPARPIFDRALDLLEASPGAAVFVGDDPRWDVTGAREAGIRPVLLDPVGRHAEDDCRRIGRLVEVLELDS